jgi:hypothetical protein
MATGLTLKAKITFFSGLVGAMLALGACTPENPGTFGPYAADAYGRTDCSFSTRVENGGLCPRVAIPVIPVAGVMAPETKLSPKGCSMIDYVSNTFVCPPPDVAPGEEVSEGPPAERYCYRTLASTECYDRPANDPRRRPVAIAPANPLSQPH